ncbi:uncharacterized protein MONBRDRAFT_44311, partial [Monosiga brevicollis MX1]
MFCYHLLSFLKPFLALTSSMDWIPLGLFLGARSGKADKRAHHNALERKRRDHIKDSFTMLRDTIPSINGEKQVQVSRAQILNKATDYIQYMRKRNQAHQAEMEELRRQNASLQMQSQMQHAKSEEDGEDI